MKFILAITAFLISSSCAIAAEATKTRKPADADKPMSQRPIMENVPTGYQVKGCTFYEILPDGRHKCVPKWRENLRSSSETNGNGD